MPSIVSVLFAQSVLGLFLLLLADLLWAAEKQSWKVQPAEQGVILIEDEVIRDTQNRLEYGFNINFKQLEKQLWDAHKKNVKGPIISALAPFDGAIYRYPGGLVANAFQWRDAIGDFNARGGQASYFDPRLKAVEFGIDEYVRFLKAVNGKPWYVLNLVGASSAAPFKLSPLEALVLNNSGLIEYLLSSLSVVKQQGEVLPLQLGNELDRARYDWPARQYVERAKAIVDANKSKSDQVLWVSSVRDFDTRLKSNKKMSRSYNLLKATMSGLPMVKDYALNHYYDSSRKDGRSRSIPFWLYLLNKSISEYESFSKQDANVWITEHARQPQTDKPGKDESVRLTSNLSAAISSADYILGLTQMPQIKGAIWHGLNAGPWQLFDYSAQRKDLSERPIYWMFRLFFKQRLEQTLSTYSLSPNHSEYAGGYDIRASAEKNTSGDQLAVTMVNRASRVQTIKLKYAKYAGQKVNLKHAYIGLPEMLDADQEHERFLLALNPEATSAQFSDSGELDIKLPASSVSKLYIQLD